jgi:hypothetical protein
VDILLIGVTVLIAASGAWTVLRPGDDDPNWELRWQGLDPGYRDWLAAMTTDPRWMGTLTDPEEVQLAKGFARRERRRLGRYDLVALVIAVLAVALAMAGVLGLGAVGIGLGLLASIRVAVESWNHRQLRRKVQLGFEPGELPTQLPRSQS